MTEKSTPTNQDQKKIVNSIPLKTAQKWAKRWRKLEGKYNKHHRLEAFLIPKIDLLEVLAEGVDAVRAYIGVDNEGVEKLMLVGTKLNPVTGIYEDMITTKTDDSNGAGVGNIYDFTNPCPPASDPGSPMFN
jgi:hypothetical protein